ncbi:trehalose-6-phosphate synthase [Alkanindiges hydrocarboniclasticus]|jgi:trehalose 6-phosphate synthase|uniref:Trehalose-6-phosphate synthase n=1 Tax=Alkanindiges hydrocarboniclasticus TaxID=1907941 RepID=A0A1S8CXL3_9GAMM|nr:trehalose-6-phosphate synthase [Alkanindiges hydrocarboniclasticus]ONG42071.1 trehalose-6-phosphate synthase [Alkanindiges hydrocarboniclasticus]
MSKLIVLSNRVSLPNPDKPAAGGLAVALQDALTETGGIWLGWNGDIIPDSRDTSADENTSHAAYQPQFGQVVDGKIEYLTCPLTQNQYDQYYCGFANNTLWPAMHERQDLLEYNPAEFETYQQVNALFARQLKAIAQPDDVIWVHDYHFFSVARYCRELGMDNKIGFFLHIPFAPLSIWQCIPTAERLIQDLCHYDLVGLQTDYDQSLCMQACTTLLKAQKIQHSLVSYQQRITTIKCYPIGINPAQIQQVAKKHANDRQDVFDLKALKHQKTIIGVDRIDYSKGILERFDAFAAFLEQYPQYHRRITELQIACPCRMDILAYQRLFRQVNQTVEKINDTFAQHDWLPIDCTNEVVPHETLMGLYRLTDICWISSLRDGMNLVAKEYIAAQDPENPGVLILSKYAGAAEQMQQALIVDPTDTQDMVNALKTAIDMPLEERLSRYQQLMQGLTTFDINDWRNQFLSDLRKNHQLENFKQPIRAVNTAYQLL